MAAMNTTTTYNTDIVSQISGLQGDLERLLPKLRLQCLELAIKSMDASATDDQIVTRAQAFAAYIRGLEPEGS